MLGELYTVIWNELVDIAVLVSFRLGVADQYDHLRMSAGAPAESRISR
jgi:hypothetical protein